MSIVKNKFISILSTSHGNISIYRIDSVEQEGFGKIERLPYTIRILLEGVLRNLDRKGVTLQQVIDLASWQPKPGSGKPAPFFPGRVVMQDLSGVPVIIDLAAMRTAMLDLGGDPRLVQPVIPVDVVIDHSIQVDYYGTPDAFQKNVALEFERNEERYKLLRWAQRAFDNLRVIPPASGIIHQINLEYLTNVVLVKDSVLGPIAYPDTLIGTDSHTTMINGLGVAGWGVGGIEAVSAMLGEPIEILLPEVIGVKLNGKLPEGATPTDLTLTLTQVLRKKGVVNKFVEFFGPGLQHLTLADRAMVANMAPESGATVLFFPIDYQTLDYLKLTGKSASQIDLVERYSKEQHLFHNDDASRPDYSEILEMDLNSIEPSLAGPKRPQDRVPLSAMKTSFRKALTQPKAERGFALDQVNLEKNDVSGSHKQLLTHGSVVLAAITSCTNTSNPFVMIGAGLLAKNAVALGLQCKSHVKTSLAPGSLVVTEYLSKSGLLEPLAALGFNLVGYGCTTCIGNTGPLPEAIVREIQENHLVTAAVLSGNRNFEGRVSPHTQANYLASPPLVVAYALAGTVDIDLTSEPLGLGQNGQSVFLKQIWPSSSDIFATITRIIDSSLFTKSYQDIFQGSSEWNKLETASGMLYRWDMDSTYLQQPPFFTGMSTHPRGNTDVLNARALACLGDSITTDHISPAGAIPVHSPAGQYLIQKGVGVQDFNSYGSRRGNDRVMVRGTFANIRLKNQIVPDIEGGFTRHFPSGEQMTIFDAAMRYKQEGTPLIILAGKEYGTGSSRDWAAKGTTLLGVKAVLAVSYERIHRSNLVGMGVLPLEFLPGENTSTFHLKGDEIFHISGIKDIKEPLSRLTVKAISQAGSEKSITMIARLDTSTEVDYFQNGGILQTILYQWLQAED